MAQFDLSDLKNKKTALVLSGGVVKAASWHLGVSLALEELGFSYKTNENSLNPIQKGLESPRVENFNFDENLKQLKAKKRKNG